MGLRIEGGRARPAFVVSIGDGRARAQDAARIRGVVARLSSFARLVLCASAASSLCGGLIAAPQGTQKTSGGEEVFEKVDPYTRGEREALDKAGYISLGPFEWFEGVRTEEVRETLGGIDVLWVETAHFKIGSTLRSYKPPGDVREDDKLAVEYGRLKKRLERFRPPGSKIDPWLRLHLYAQRIEDVYADFCAAFGVTDADFQSAGRSASPEATITGNGPYLGMDRKFTVLLLEKTSGLGRFLRRYAQREAEAWDRLHLNGSMFLGVSSEGVMALGYELDEALHCAVASETTHILIGGFRQSWYMTPAWLEFGLAHVAAKKVDERFVPAVGMRRSIEEEEWKWQPRVRGLVENKVAKPWVDALAWQTWEELKGQGHLTSWSRVSWLLDTRKPAEMKAFLMAITEPQPDELYEAAAEQKAKFLRERQTAAAKSAFGKGFEELDGEWRKFVQKKYPKK